jgi:hypothetical protein
MKPEIRLKPHWEPYHDRIPISPWGLAQILVALAIVVAGAFGFLLMDQQAVFWWLGVTVGILGPTYLVLTHLESRRRIQSQSLLSAKRFQVCPECLYDLSCVNGQATCPECATPFDAESLPEVWRLIDQRAQEPSRD